MGAGLGCTISVADKRLFKKIRRIRVDRTKLDDNQKLILRKAQHRADREYIFEREETLTLWLLAVSEKKLDAMTSTFMSADVDHSGTMEYEEFLDVFELHDGPLAKSLWSYYGMVRHRYIRGGIGREFRLCYPDFEWHYLDYCNSCLFFCCRRGWGRAHRFCGVHQGSHRSDLHDRNNGKDRMGL